MRAEAFALAAVQALGASAIELPLGAELRAEIERVLALPYEERASLIAKLIAPRPFGLEDVHPEWIEPALDPRLTALPDGPVRVWADRLRYGSLVSMPGPGPIEGPADLPRARADWITQRLERIGLGQLAHATSAAPRVELAALAARLGRRGTAYIEMVKRVRDLAPAARRAAQSRCDGIRIARDPLAFVALGARTLAPHLAGDTPRQLAQRLPRAIGLRLLEELGAPWKQLDAPAWSEMIRA